MFKEGFHDIFITEEDLNIIQSYATDFVDNVLNVSLLNSDDDDA